MGTWAFARVVMCPKNICELICKGFGYRALATRIRQSCYKRCEGCEFLIHTKSELAAFANSSGSNKKTAEGDTAVIR